MNVCDLTRFLLGFAGVWVCGVPFDYKGLNSDYRGVG